MLENLFSLHATNEMLKIHHSHRSRHDTVEEANFCVGERIVRLQEKHILHLLVIKQTASVQLPVVNVDFTPTVARYVQVHLWKYPSLLYSVILCSETDVIISNYVYAYDKSPSS